MAQESSPAFQFYPKDFLTDGNVAAMALEERGAYITLLCLCWQECSLPDDTKRLAQMVGITHKAFLRLWPALRVCFQPEDGRLRQRRLEQERVKQHDYRRRQSEAGKASAAARQPDGNHGSTNGQPEGQPNGNQTANQKATGRQPKGNSPSSVRTKNVQAVQAAAQTPPPENRPKDDKVPTVPLLRKLAYQVLDENPDDAFPDQREALKRACARYDLTPTPEALATELETAIRLRTLDRTKKAIGA